MTTNPPQPRPEWSTSGLPSSEPLDALPAAEDGFHGAGDRFHTGPQDRFHTGPQDRLHTGPQDRLPGGPGRWPTTRSPWPGAVMAHPQPAGRSGPGTGQQPLAAAQEPAEPPSQPGPAEPGDERLATLSYLGVPFLGPLVPLAIYLLKKRTSGYVRSHSAQALNLSITTLLYTVCALILGAMLALDNIVIALIIVVPLAVALWLATLGYVIVAGSKANRGDYYPIPAWFCAALVR